MFGILVSLKSPFYLLFVICICHFITIHLLLSWITHSFLDEFPHDSSNKAEINYSSCSLWIMESFAIGYLDEILVTGRIKYLSYILH